MITTVLRNHNIDYRIVNKEDNIITILIHQYDLETIHIIMSENRFFVAEHKWAVSKGYIYRYGAHEAIFYSRGDICIEFFTELLCLSLTPFNVIPLDNEIQKWAWEKQYIEKDETWVDERIIFIEVLIHSIFEAKMINNSDIDTIKKYKYLLDDSQMYEMCKKIFFRYSDELFRIVRNEEFDNFYDRYIGFINY